MRFEPIPENDFMPFIYTYYSECKKLVPQLEAIIGKWNFEDLIPGLSDFDSRFIFSNSMDVEDWINMSTSVGDVHLKLCIEHPEWARKLEHTPGINLTWEEVLDKQFYYPEFLQWSPYYGDKGAFNGIRSKLLDKGWSQKDEVYHLKRFFTYFGPYIRGIDPAVNLGKFENKYPLHSRMMHYFLPPLQSGLSIIRKETIRGKLETLKIAQEMLPMLKSIDKICSAVEKHYEIPQMYKAPYLYNLERELEADLYVLFQAMKSAVSVIPFQKSDDPVLYKEALAKLTIDNTLEIFSGLRFSRTMKGRLIFYSNIDRHFDSIWLIENELERMGNNFLILPLTKYWDLRENKKEDDILKILKNLKGELFNREDIEILSYFHILTSKPIKKGEQKKQALEIAGIFDDFYRSINKLVMDVKRKRS